MSTVIYGVPLWLIVVVAIIALPFVGYLVLRALREGREISFWPPRIGARVLDEKTKEKLPSESLQDASSFFGEEFPPDFWENYSNARDLWLIGLTLRRWLDYKKLGKKLQQGHTIRVLLVHPKGDALEMAASRYCSEEHRKATELRIENSLRQFCELRKTAPQQMEIRTIQNPLTFGAICINPDSTSGVLYLEHFPYRTVSDALPKFVLRASDGRWYRFFNEEIHTLWNDGVAWECSDSPSAAESAAHSARAAPVENTPK